MALSDPGDVGALRHTKIDTLSQWIGALKPLYIRRPYLHTVHNLHIHYDHVIVIWSDYCDTMALE